ncbi:uncharacterized protein BJ212DRAFT_1295828 [Suillus subaureus]|uniref:Uncharacterized protein n=1 Tax=Suillus subaureus TaxID=48587 RepID=A0A9P7JIL0_9AGAM|nr:uncharacterized protein BJ212DRAFT_1295828 [Suillus subaureus]KAG1824726.1 hypothetical protein BJ212DRAFT_1295828 [Suillus subaureus]
MNYAEYKPNTGVRTPTLLSSSFISPDETYDTSCMPTPSPPHSRIRQSRTAVYAKAYFVCWGHKAVMNSASRVAHAVCKLGKAPNMRGRLQIQPKVLANTRSGWAEELEEGSEDEEEEEEECVVDNAIYESQAMMSRIGCVKWVKMSLMFVL